MSPSPSKRKIADQAAELDPASILTGPYRMRAPQPLDLKNCTKEQLLEYFDDSYSLNESLFTILKTEDVFYMRPDRLRLPLIFYYGHTASVYVNKLLPTGFLKERVNNHFETIFETGVNENKWDNVKNSRMGGSFKWPALKEVVEFRKKVRELVREKIFSTELQVPINQDSPWWGVLMVIDHDAVHTETSSVLLQQLPIDHVRVPYGWRRGPLVADVPVEQNKMIPVPAQTVTFGKPLGFPSFGWNIDYPQHQRSISRFEASKYLISNREFCEFMDSGGYSNKEVWTEEGWKWREASKAIHPLFWICNNGCKSGCGGPLESYSHCTPRANDHEDKKATNGAKTGKAQYRLRTICEEIEMPWDWPVNVNFHEAKTYCNWLGADYRLLAEAELHAVRDFPPIKSMDASLDIPWDPELSKKFNINLTYTTSTPVNLFPANQLGFHDVAGNLWCWMEDHVNGLPGYQSHDLYDDYAKTYFDSKHTVMLGGSWVSNGYQASRFVRTWFRRHFYQHVGFRVAKTVDKSRNPPITMVKNPYGSLDEVEVPFYVKDPPTLWSDPENPQFRDEAPETLRQRLQQEYESGSGRVTKLCDAITELVEKYKVDQKRLLDIGCGCGAVSFNLAQKFAEVVGMDNCSNYIGAAMSILNNGDLSLVKSIVGVDFVDNHKLDEAAAVIHDQTNLDGVILKLFSWIPNELSNFDLVVHQISDRVVNKKAWLLRLWELINKEGLAVIVSSDGLDEGALQDLVGPRLKCMDTQRVDHQDTSGASTSTVLTSWRLV